MARSRTDNHGLEDLRLCEPGTVHRNLQTRQLCERAVRRGEGTVAHLGPLAVRDGGPAGPAAGDRFIVRGASSSAALWWGDSHRPITRQRFGRLQQRLRAYFDKREVFVQEGWAGADPRHRLAVRAVTETAWHSLFARHLLWRDEAFPPPRGEPRLTVLHAPGCAADPRIDGTRSRAFALLDLDRRLALIGGTACAGELKRAIFAVMSSLLVRRRVLPMRCAANRGAPDNSATDRDTDRDDVALFFGPSGSGKTTLAADPDRALIGDDAHGWSARGIFTFEGGCYPRLAIGAGAGTQGATRRFGTILENVMLDPASRRLDFVPFRATGDARAAYPITYVLHAAAAGIGGHARHLVLLIADPSGVLPPIARLTPGQAQYHLLSGYSPAWTGGCPEAAFDPCFGPPFLPLHPTVYVHLLGLEVLRHGARCWLLNTGWSGGPPGVGERIELGATRAMLRAALDGSLAGALTRREQAFGLEVPLTCPGVATARLDPRAAWRDAGAYDRAARELAGRFRDNFRQFEECAADDVKDAGPRAA